MRARKSEEKKQHTLVDTLGPMLHAVAHPADVQDHDGGAMAMGIQTQVHYIPLHFQPFHRQFHPDLQLPGAEAFYRRTLSLPLFAAMTEGDMARAVHTLRNVLGP